MNFFSNTNDFARGMMNMMNGASWNTGNAKEKDLRQKLQKCTYPDDTKFVIQKAAKQVFHVYSYFNADFLRFTQGMYQRVFIELKGKTCKVDFNMMLPLQFPRTAPCVRIINRSPEYKVDSFYQSCQSKTEPSSYILNDKLMTCKNWSPSSNLVNVIMECCDCFKARFPFVKPSTGSSGFGGSNNPWDQIYNKNTGNGSWGTNQINPQNNGWNNYGGNNGGSGFIQAPSTNVGWGNNQGWNQNTGNNQWGNNGGMNGWNNAGMGMGMGGINNNQTMNAIASAQKLVAKQKDILSKLKGKYQILLQKNQLLDITKKSLQSQQEYLRNENYQMSNFLKSNQNSTLPDITKLVTPSNQFSEQVLSLISSIKARQECTQLLQTRFNEQKMSLQQFLKQARKIQQSRFQQKALLNKCLLSAQ